MTDILTKLCAAGARLGDASNRAVATGVPMSAVPQVSQFWSAETDGVLTNDVQFAWRYGSIVWQVPMGWGEEEEDPNFGELLDCLTTGETQKMVMFSDGKFGVRKFRHMVTREVDGTVNLDGRQVQ